MGAARSFPHDATAVRAGAFPTNCGFESRLGALTFGEAHSGYTEFSGIGQLALGSGRASVSRHGMCTAYWLLYGGCCALPLVGAMICCQALLRSSCNFGASLAGALTRAQSCKLGRFHPGATHGGCTGSRSFDSTLCSETRLRLSRER